MVSFLADIMKNLVAVISLVFVCFSDGASGFEFEDCALVPEKTVFIHKLEVTPHPIIVTEDVNVSVLFRVMEAIYANATVEVKLVRINRGEILSEVTIPCVLGYIGSCTYNACSYFNLQKEIICKFFPKDEKCECPVKTGIYQGENISLSLPLIRRFGRYLAEAKYISEIKILQGGTGRILGCIKVMTEVRFKDHCQQSSTTSFR